MFAIFIQNIVVGSLASYKPLASQQDSLPNQKLNFRIKC